MEGVTVLSSEVVSGDGTALLIIGIVCFVLACAALAIGIYMCIYGCGYGGLIIGGAILLALLGFNAINDSANEKEYEKLKVIVEDSVSYNDFTSRYEVISQDGDIWIVKEKE